MKLAVSISAIVGAEGAAIRNKFAAKLTFMAALTCESTQVSAGSRILRPVKNWWKCHDITRLRKLDVRNYPSIVPGQVFPDLLGITAHTMTRRQHIGCH